MPRRNRRQKKRQYFPPGVKPKGGKRPRGWHRGGHQDERFRDAERRWPDAQGEGGVA